jgi:nucleotide-binding universal stress UspA family protein
MGPDRNGKPILFAYDGSEASKQSIRDAGRELGRDRDAIVVTVWDPLTAFPFVSTGLADADIVDEMGSGARRVAAEGAELARAAGFHGTPLTETGSPVWRVVLDVAHDQDAGLLVLGSHSRSRLPHVPLGSVSAAVVRHSERPVLIVHPRHG